MKNLEQELRNLYENSKKGYQVANIIYFGIQNSNRLKNFENSDLVKLSINATGKSSYSTEIRKGIKLYDLLKEKNENN